MATAIETGVTIENIGAVHHLEIPIPPDGGVVVLTGRNGTGKSTALRATESLLSGSKPPGPSDGSTNGVVEGFGVTIKVGRTSRRSGELTVAGLEGRFDLSKLVDPGIKDPTAADVARIRALIGLTGVVADTSVFVDLAGGKESLAKAVAVEDLQTDDLVEMAGRVKRGFERLARIEEQAADHEIAAADALKAHASEDEGEQFPTEAEMRESFRSACEFKSRLEQRAKQAAKAVEDAAKMRSDLESAKELLEQIGSVAALRLQLDESRKLMDANRDRIVELNGEIEKLLSENQREQVRFDGFHRELQAAETTAALVTSLEERVASIADVVPPTAEELETADRAIASSQSRIERHGASRKAREAWAKTRQHKENAKQHTALAERLRSMAAGCEGVLTDAVAKAGVPLKVQVKDGTTRLVIDTRRGVTPFAELSDGERWKLAIDVATTCLPSHAVFFISQEGWEALDPINRSLVDEHARSHGVTILTAEASDEPQVTARQFEVN